MIYTLKGSYISPQLKSLTPPPQHLSPKHDTNTARLVGTTAII